MTARTSDPIVRGEGRGGVGLHATLDLAGVTRLDDELAPQFLEHHGVLPVRVEEGRVLVATWREDVDEQTIDELRFRFGSEPQLVLASEPETRAAIRRVYGQEATTAEALLEDLDDSPEGGTLQDRVGEAAIDDLLAQANEAPVVRLVNMIISEALEAGASDVHLEQTPDGIVGRYRVDGVLVGTPAIPRRLSAAIISRLKVMANLDIAERRLPQDGRIRLTLSDRKVDVRISTLPVLHGEGVVLRLLDKRERRLALEALGMPEEIRRSFLLAASQPNGIVLVTGPTGSGKTTTLYAVLDEIRTGREKILTVEDPVEYELDGVAQVPVNTKVGLTFARALRSLLRQDPDILMVGEIRDGETAEIATHAALTGHLVLSTLHTNDAASAVLRLEDLGVPAFLVASTVHGVLAQRLVRKTCTVCGASLGEGGTSSGEGGSSLGEEWTSNLGTERASGGADPVCAECHGTGYRGRIGIFQYIGLDNQLREHIHGHHSSTSLRDLALAKGMRTLRDDAQRLIRKGLTSKDEVLRVLGPVEGE